MPDLADLPEKISLPGRRLDDTLIDVRVRNFFHAGRILDYAMLRRISVADAVREIIDNPGGAYVWFNRNAVTPTRPFQPGAPDAPAH
jgi:hypothetical protein